MKTSIPLLRHWCTCSLRVRYVIIRHARNYIWWRREKSVHCWIPAGGFLLLHRRVVIISSPRLNFSSSPRPVLLRCVSEWPPPPPLLRYPIGRLLAIAVPSVYRPYKTGAYLSQMPVKIMQIPDARSRHQQHFKETAATGIPRVRN